jgi:hypothetical protein
MLGTFTRLEEIGSSMCCCHRNLVCFELARRIQRLGATATPTLTTPSPTSPAVARIRPPTKAKVAPEALSIGRRSRVSFPLDRHSPIGRLGRGGDVGEVPVRPDSEERCCRRRHALDRHTTMRAEKPRSNKRPRGALRRPRRSM